MAAHTGARSPPRAFARALCALDSGCKDQVFYITASLLAERRLAVRPDPEAPAIHAFVEPERTVALEEFERALRATRPAWKVAWP